MWLLDLIWFLLIGLAAGWLASKIMKTGHRGIVGNLIVGVIGALLGGVIFGLVGFAAVNKIGSLITATLGAMLLIFVLRKIRRA